MAALSLGWGGGHGQKTPLLGDGHQPKTCTASFCHDPDLTRVVLRGDRTRSSPDGLIPRCARSALPCAATCRGSAGAPRGASAMSWTSNLGRHLRGNGKVIGLGAWPVRVGLWDFLANRSSRYFVPASAGLGDFLANCSIQAGNVRGLLAAALSGLRRAEEAEGGQSAQAGRDHPCRRA